MLLLRDGLLSPLDLAKCLTVPNVVKPRRAQTLRTVP